MNLPDSVRSFPTWHTRCSVRHVPRKVAGRRDTPMTKVSMLTRAVAVGVVSVLSMGTLASVPAEAKDNSATPGLQIPVVGTTSTGGTFAGTATITSFAVSGNNVVAVGTISGVIDGAQSVIATFTAPVGIPQTSATAPAAAQAAAASSCDILNLTLGPINLNLLGLVVSIPNPVILNITAVPGAGNLLGNLLCSVAGLLNGGGALQQVAGLLNQILGILSGL